MAGNSQRRGATRKPGSKKGSSVGSGGQRRRALEGKGPTPKAEDRVSHPAHKRTKQAERRAAQGGGGGSARRAVPDDTVVGRNPVVEALRAAVPARELLVAEGIDADDRVAEAVALATSARVRVSSSPKRDLDRAAGEANHQGLVLRTEPFGYADPEALFSEALAASAQPVIVALDGITDPHNLGAIARSALAFAAAGLLVPSRRSAGVTAAAWRSSAGAFARLPVARATNLARAVGQAQAAGFFVITLDGSARRTVAESAEHFADVPLLVVVGSEGAGVSRIVGDRADQAARIELPGGAESLNASVAAGIALYSIVQARQHT